MNLRDRQNCDNCCLTLSPASATSWFPPPRTFWLGSWLKQNTLSFPASCENSSKTIQMFPWKWHRFIHSTLIVTHFASEWNRTSVIWMSVTDNSGVQLMGFYMWMLKWRSSFSHAIFANVFGKNNLYLTWAFVHNSKKLFRSTCWNQRCREKGAAGAERFRKSLSIWPVRLFLSPSSHQTQTTCWDHPKMAELYQSLGKMLIHISI